MQKKKSSCYQDEIGEVSKQVGRTAGWDFFLFLKSVARGHAVHGPKDLTDLWVRKRLNNCKSSKRLPTGLKLAPNLCKIFGYCVAGSARFMDRHRAKHCGWNTGLGTSVWLVIGVRYGPMRMLCICWSIEPAYEEFVWLGNTCTINWPHIPRVGISLNRENCPSCRMEF